MNYWLLKSEPSGFSIDDLAARPHQTDHWDGVRNYQARNFMRDRMKRNDRALFYHSNCKERGVVAIVEISREAYPDTTAFDPKSPYFDPKSDAANPRWFMVDVRLVRRLRRLIRLDEIKRNPALADMALVQRGNRLSVMPVTAAQWKAILRMEAH
ncbi:MAG: EVE domain-containing protein [Acidiferrobacterales bacterium]